MSENTAAPTTHQTPEECAREMGRFCNIIGGREDLEQFVEAMGYEHRTLQQGFTKLCLHWLYWLAAHDGPDHVDLRNEAAHGVAEKVAKALGPYGADLPVI